jgi:hypothetical protein
VFAEKGTAIIPAVRPVRVGYQRELLVDYKKFLTGRAAGLSNGVKRYLLQKERWGDKVMRRWGERVIMRLFC